MSSTRVKLQEEILLDAGVVKRCRRLTGLSQADTLPQDVKAEDGNMEMGGCPINTSKRSGKFDEQAREKYRIIAIADTAREQPAITVNITQRQPRLTVTNFAAKVDALKIGLGIGTLPKALATELIEQGALKAITDVDSQSIDIILAWKRNKIGEAKSWCIQYLMKNWKANAKV